MFQLRLLSTIILTPFVSVSLLIFIATEKTLYRPYGMYIALPPSGPETGGTEVMVVGSGFQDNGKARCRFGVPGDFSIVEGRVLSKGQNLNLS